MTGLFRTFIAASLLMVSLPAAQANAADVIRIHSSDLLRQGITALRKGNMERAIVSLEKFLDQPASRSNRVAAHNNLCIAYHFAGDLDNAIEQCDLAIELNPKYWRAYNNRGNVHLTAGAYAEAGSDYETALDINPKARAAKENLELIRSRSGGLTK